MDQTPEKSVSKINCLNCSKKKFHYKNNKEERVYRRTISKLLLLLKSILKDLFVC